MNSEQVEKLAHLGTSCPDHFIRTKIRPMFIKWNPVGDPAEIKELITGHLISSSMAASQRPTSDEAIR